MSQFSKIPKVNEPETPFSIYYIFVNDPDEILLSGNIISDISDHFSQFCIIKAARDKYTGHTTKCAIFPNFPLTNSIIPNRTFSVENFNYFFCPKRCCYGLHCGKSFFYPFPMHAHSSSLARDDASLEPATPTQVVSEGERNPKKEGPFIDTER